MSVWVQMPKQKIKTGACDIHFYNHNDKKKRKVKKDSQSGLWVCNNCQDPVLIAMASISKKQSKQKGKKKK